jgi:F420-dependent oxidoreductase-like protein
VSGDTAAGLRWGAFVPQGWKLEFAGVAAPEAWHRARSIALLAEEIGYDHLWVYDHVETVPRREPDVCFEAWTMMAALAEVTDEARLGQLVTCAAYRNAGLLAKEAACVDVMSGGRLIFGIGAGWFDEEYEAYGWDFPPARERLAILRETVEATKRLWTEERVTYEGAHVRLREALCDPKPTQSPPPIWIGGGGEKVTLRIAAEHADATNWQVGLNEFVRKSQVLRHHCEAVGRDFHAVTRTHAPDCILFDSDADLARWLDSDDGGHLWGSEPDDVYVRDNFVGTDDVVAEKVQGFVDAGCREFVLWFRDYPATESLERFMADVVPRVRL